MGGHVDATLGVRTGRLWVVLTISPHKYVLSGACVLFQGLFEVLRRLYAPEAQQQADENNCEGKLDERERG